MPLTNELAQTSKDSRGKRLAEHPNQITNESHWNVRSLPLPQLISLVPIAKPSKKPATGIPARQSSMERRSLSNDNIDSQDDGRQALPHAGN